MEHQNLNKWQSETDQQLLNRHHDGNVVGIQGESFWGKMNELHEHLKQRNLI